MTCPGNWSSWFTRNCGSKNSSDDGAEIDVVEIGLERQTLKRPPPFAGRNNSTKSPFIGCFWLEIAITAKVRSRLPMR